MIWNRWELAEEITLEEGELLAFNKGRELGRGEAGDRADDGGDAVSCLKEGGEEAHANVAVSAGEEDVH